MLCGDISIRYCLLDLSMHTVPQEDLALSFRGVGVRVGIRLAKLEVGFSEYKRAALQCPEVVVSGRVE